MFRLLLLLLLEYGHKKSVELYVHIFKLKALRKPEITKMIETAVPRIRVKLSCLSSVTSSVCVYTQAFKFHCNL